MPWDNQNPHFFRRGGGRNVSIISFYLGNWFKIMAVNWLVISPTVDKVVSIWLEKKQIKTKINPKIIMAPTLVLFILKHIIQYKKGPLIF